MHNAFIYQKLYGYLYTKLTSLIQYQIIIMKIGEESRIKQLFHADQADRSNK
jgi:hypothetical protein